MDVCLFSKEKVQPVQWKITLDFISGYLMESGIIMCSARIHEDLRSKDIGLQENIRILNGSVHMGFCSEVHHDVKVLFIKQVEDEITIGDVSLYKLEVWILQRFLKR